MKKISLLCGFILSSYGYSAIEHNCFPENSVKIPTKNKIFGPSLFGIKSNSSQMGLTQLEFGEVINKFHDYWNPIIQEKYQKKLIFENSWEESRVNASATRDDDNNPVIRVNGGLARHPDITKNGLMMILCHELGHHLGGAPKSFRGRSKKRSWSSAEGQADYFATTKCMAKMVIDNQIFPEPFKYSVKACNNSLCRKIAPAALSVGNLFASLKGEWKKPSLDKKSKNQVYSTYYLHPTPQCRLDTFIAGSLCTQDFEKDFDDFDHKVGSCIQDLDPDAARPKCWFSHEKY
jgi:hypothetical protein